MNNDNNNTKTANDSNTTGATPAAPDDHADIQASPEQTEQFRVAFDRLAGERAAVPRDRIEPINVDIPTVVDIVLGHVPQIHELGAEAKGLPGFDAAVFDKMESYAQALAYAQMLYNAASTPVPEVPALADEVAALRARFSADAEALSVRGLIDGSRLKDLKGGPGYKNIAYDVGSLVALLRASWPKIAGKTAITQDELTNAQILTEKLLLAVAAREQQKAAETEASDQRSRAYTLLNQAYDQVRRAATYLRWGDAIDDVTPSFYNGRTGVSKPKTTTAVAATPPAAPSPATPVATTPPIIPTAMKPGLPGATPFAS